MKNVKNESVGTVICGIFRGNRGYLYNGSFSFPIPVTRILHIFFPNINTIQHILEAAR